MWCMKSQFFDSRYAYGAKRSSNGRRDLPKLSSKCIPKHPKSTTKMHRSAIYTHRERENRWFHRCRKSNENMNYKIACFSLPCVRIGLQWSPAPSKKCWKFIKKQQKFFKNRVGSTARLSGRVVGQSYARLKAEIELHNIRTTTEHDSQPPTVHFWFLCPAATTSAPSRSRTPPSPPRNRNANQYKSTEKYRKSTEIQVCHREVRVELNGGAHRIRDGKISRFPLLQHLPRCPSAGATFPSAGTENAIPKSSATSSGVPLRLPLSKIRVAHGRPNFCFQSLYEMSTQWWPF